VITNKIIGVKNANFKGFRRQSLRIGVPRLSLGTREGEKERNERRRERNED
jgi:hypothetical protein